MLKKYKSLVLCCLSLLFTASMCVGDPDIDDAVLVKKITLDQTSAVLEVGKTLTLTATISPEDATCQDLRWASSDKSVAVVEDGEVAALSVGVAAITATAIDGSGKSAACVITVTERSGSENDSIVGDSILGDSVLGDVEQVVLVEKIELSHEQAKIELGSVLTLMATVTPDNAADTSLVWSSSDPAVAVVEEGHVMGMGYGKAIITAMACDGSGVSASCEVEVAMGTIMPTGQKARLQDIGLEFLGAIRAETHENLVRVLSYMERKLGDLDLDEDYINKLEALYTEESGYGYAPARKANPVAAIQGLMALSLDVAQEGAQLATRAGDIYMLTLKAGLKDLYGGFTPDMKYQEWRYDGSINDRLEVQFADDRNQTWVATLKGSEETSRVHVTGDDIYSWSWSYGGNVEDASSGREKIDIAIDVPKLITLVVKCNEREVINLNVESSVAFDVDFYASWDEYSGYDENDNYFANEKNEFSMKLDYSNLNFDAALDVNGYAESWAVEASRSRIESWGEVKIDGKSMLEANAAANGDMDHFIKQINEANNYSEYYDGNEYVRDNNFEFDPSCLSDFAMKLNIMGKAQIKGRCDDFTAFYRAARFAEEGTYDGYDEDEAWTKGIEAFNDTYSLDVYYDNSSTVQANLELEPVVYVDDYYDYATYGIRPVIVFAADGSRYAFADYFTEGNFSRLVEAFEQLADDFERMFEDAYGR